MPDVTLDAEITASSLNILDISIGCGLLLFTVIGIIRGFTNDVLSLFTWVGAIVLTSFLFPPLQPLVRPYITEPFFADIVLGFLIFIFSLIVLVALAKGISGMVRRSILSGLDRSLGLISGTFRAMVLLTILYTGSLLFFKPGALPEVYQQARFVPILNLSAQWMYLHLVPQELFPKRLADHLIENDTGLNKEPSAEALVKSLSNPKPGVQDKNPQNQTESGDTSPKDTSPKAALREGYKIMERKALESLIDTIAPGPNESPSDPQP